jgi:ureidoglycolate lyase
MNESQLTIVRAEPLLADTFARFGEVLGPSAGGEDGKLVNLETARRFDHAARLENARTKAHPNLAFFHCTPVALPFRITLLERHPHSTQAFLPLAGARWLVCVAPDGAGGKPDLAGLRAFIGGPGIGVNFRRGLWHHPILALDEPARLAMLAWEDGTPADAEEWRVPQALEVHTP